MAYRQMINQAEGDLRSAAHNRHEFLDRPNEQPLKSAVSAFRLTLKGRLAW